MHRSQCSHIEEVIFECFCLECFAEVLISKSALKIYKIQSIKDLVRTVISDSSGIKNYLINDPEATYQIVLLLVNALATEDAVLVPLCCEAIHLICCVTRHEQVAKMLVAEVTSLTMASCDLTKALPFIHLLGKLLNSFHGLSWYIVTHKAEYLDMLSDEILHLNPSVATEVLYTFQQVFQNEPRSLYTLSEALVGRIIHDVCVVLSIGGGKDASRNALALMRLFVISQTCRYRLFFTPNSESGMSAFDCLKACIIHNEIDFQVASVQIVSLALESEFECQAQNRGTELLNRFLTENFAEHLFESLVSSNFLLLESSLHCLTLLENSKDYYSYKHVIYAVPSLIRLCQTLREKSTSATILATTMQRLVNVLLRFDTSRNHANPLHSYQTAVLSLIDETLGSPNPDIQQCSTMLLMLLLEKENLPKPLPITTLKKLVIAAVQTNFLDPLVEVSKGIVKSPDDGPSSSAVFIAEKDLEKLQFSFELMTKIIRLYIESENDPTLFLSSYSCDDSGGEPSEAVDLRELILDFLKLLCYLENLPFGDAPLCLLVSIFEFFHLCFGEEVLASALIYSIGENLLGLSVTTRNMAAEKRDDKLLEAVNTFLSAVLKRYIPSDTRNWLDSIKCLPADPSRWYQFLCDRKPSMKDKETAIVLIYLCYTTCKTSDHLDDASYEEGKTRALEIYLSDLNADGSCTNATVLKAVWYLVAVNCPPSHGASFQLLRILEKYDNLSEIYTDDPALLLWSHGSDQLSVKLGQMTLLLFLENSTVPETLPDRNLKILDSLISALTLDPNEKVVGLSKKIIQQGGNIAEYLAELICEHLSKILLRAPKADRTLLALTQLLLECVKQEETRSMGLDERMLAVVVGNISKTADLTKPEFFDFLYKVCDYLQCSLLTLKGQDATRAATLVAGEACYTSTLTTVLEAGAAKAKILNLVTTLACVLPSTFQGDDVLVLNLNDLLDSLDESPFEDLIASLQVMLLALRSDFHIPLLRFKVDDEKLFMEVLVWKLENLALTYSSIADDLIWICLVEAFTYSQKKSYFVEVVAENTAIYHLLTLKLDCDSLLQLPLECLMFVKTFIDSVQPIKEKIVFTCAYDEFVDYLKRKVRSSLEQLPGDLFHNEKSVFSRQQSCDASDPHFFVFKEIANHLGFSL